MVRKSVYHCSFLRSAIVQLLQKRVRKGFSRSNSFSRVRVQHAGQKVAASALCQLNLQPIEVDVALFVPFDHVLDVTTRKRKHSGHHLVEEHPD
jgi:hypothetical protein